MRYAHPGFFTTISISLPQVAMHIVRYAVVCKLGYFHHSVASVTRALCIFNSNSGFSTYDSIRNCSVFSHVVCLPVLVDTAGSPPQEKAFFAGYLSMPGSRLRSIRLSGENNPRSSRVGVAGASC